jgi:hypothetical protein
MAAQPQPLPLPVVASGRILYVDEVLTQGAQLHGAAVRVLGRCARARRSALARRAAHAPDAACAAA